MNLNTDKADEIEGVSVQNALVSQNLKIGQKNCIPPFFSSTVHRVQILGNIYIFQD